MIDDHDEDTGDNLDNMSTASGSGKESKKNLPEEQHFHTQLSDEIKFRDYLMSQITDVIEEKMERRIRKTMTFLQNVFVAIAILLAPSAWFAVNNLIGKAINQQAAIFDQKITENNALLAKNRQEMNDTIRLETMYLTTANYATFLNENSSMTQTELDSLVNTLADLSKHKDIISRPGFILVLTNITDSLIKFGYGGMLRDIQKDYEGLISKSPDLSGIFLHYYARQLLSTSNTDKLRDSALFQSYLTVRFYLAENNNEYLSLPMDTLISFHLAEEVRNGTTSRTIDSAKALSITQRAYFIWDLISQTDPKFTRENPAPSDFLVAQVANKLFVAYKDEIMSIALSNGVKEEILRRYQSSRDPSEKQLGETILRTIYNVSPDNAG